MGSSSAENLDPRVVKFIRRHHVLTLATSDVDGAPYCCNAFYSYDVERNVFVFASNHDTRHVAHMTRNCEVAASVVLESRVVGRLQGLQIVGRVVEASQADRESYIAAFPYAALSSLTLWRIELQFMKYTDNTLGFGTKLVWQN
ncbi:MAG: pyridoxamine 5'-phosphate oxidase family protein [Rikenellaceae bacterium]